MQVIAHVRNDFTTKFGIPRQSGLVKEVLSDIVLEPEYRKAEALRGLDGFSHIWLIWQFSETVRKQWSPTVRPPRLGGNKRMGVFATRSPFRPNAIGLSCVKLESILWEEKQGPVIRVSGADLMNGTPILDIKPYLPYVDCVPEAIGGFAADYQDYSLDVDFPSHLREQIPREKQQAMIHVLAQDPRPAYQQDSKRIYGLVFGGYEIKFTVDGKQLHVCSVEKQM